MLTMNNVNFNSQSPHQLQQINPSTIVSVPSGQNNQVQATVVGRPYEILSENNVISNKVDDEHDDLADSDSEEHIYLSVELNAATVQKLRVLNVEQCNYLKQLGVLSIEFENDKYGMYLSSPKKLSFSCTKSTKTDDMSVAAASNLTPATSFAYVPTSGLVLDEPAMTQQYANLSAYGPQGGKQQFTMPCPMLKNLLKNENSQQVDMSMTQSDELMRIIRLRQALANQTTTQETATNTATVTSTTAKKPRSRAQQGEKSEKPKTKRTKANKTDQSGEAKTGQAGDSSAASGVQQVQQHLKKDHLPQEKIRNILSEAQNYQQMAMASQLGQSTVQPQPTQMQQIPHQSQQVHQVQLHQQLQPQQMQQQQQQQHQPSYHMNVYGPDQQVSFVAHPVNMANHGQSVSNITSNSKIEPNSM